MDYQRLIEQLPGLYVNWGRDGVQAQVEQAERFAAVLAEFGLEDAAVLNLLLLLNQAVGCLEPDEVYCEVGCGRGMFLVSALLEHPEVLAYAVEPFSAIDADDTAASRQQALNQTLDRFNLTGQVWVCDQDGLDFLGSLRELESDDRIGLYVYAGDADYRSLLLGLLLVCPFLAERSLIVVRDSQHPVAQQAIWDFVAVQPSCRLAFEAPILPGLSLLIWDGAQPHGYDWQTLKRRQQPSVIQAMAQLAAGIDADRAQLNQQLAQGLSLHQAGDLATAESIYRAILQRDPQRVSAWENLGALYYMQGQHERALGVLLRAVAIAPNATQHYNLGLVWQALGDRTEAIQAYQRAIQLDPHQSDAYNNLGNLWAIAGDLPQAETLYRRAIAVAPRHGGGYLNLGNLLLAQQRTEEAIAVYQAGLQQQSHDYDLLRSLASVYAATNRHRAAAQLYARALQHYPDALALKFENQRLLPVLYETEAEIEFYRRRFTQALDELIQQLSLESRSEKEAALQGISSGSNFYLQYQGKNDWALQAKYGQLVHQIMVANYPQWNVPRSLPPLAADGRIRVGYLSGFMRLHSVAKTSLGFLKHSDRSQFELYCYYTDSRQDGVTRLFQAYSDQFRLYPASPIGSDTADGTHAHLLAAIAEQILADRLHILVYLDLGMNILAGQLAGLRLAPIQCSVGAHPVTSGSPVIDYFISSELMEPEDGASHYCEQLVRLPNLGIAYAKPELPQPGKTRAEFGLPADAVIYLSCQSLYKYLPQHDWVFAAIARQVPQAKFVFLADITGRHTTHLFQQRLRQAFRQFDLDSEDYCMILPRQDPVGFLHLNQVSDVFLDGLSWSGCNTTFEAIACHLPVVTCPGAVMRARHAAAILTLMGITETIAADESAYVALAVRLGQDARWRQEIVEKIRQRHHLIYEDITCVEALETFYRQAVGRETIPTG